MVKIKELFKLQHLETGSCLFATKMKMQIMFLEEAVFNFEMSNREYFFGKL